MGARRDWHPTKYSILLSYGVCALLWGTTGRLGYLIRVMALLLGLPASWSMHLDFKQSASLAFHPGTVYTLIGFAFICPCVLAFI